MHRRIPALAAAVLSGLLLAGCGSDDNGGTIAEPPADDVTKISVEAAAFAFNPTEIERTAGEDVQFVVDNSDDVKHNLTIEGIGVDMDVEGKKSAEAPVTEDLKPGTYKYHCEYHPAQMQGTLTVT
jgi:plastocyanin